MRRMGLCIAFLVVLAAFVSPARAGLRKGHGEIGFDFGAVAWDEDLGGQTGPFLKARGGYLFARWFELEAQVGYSAHYDETMIGGERHFKSDQHMTQYFLSGVVNFPSKNGNIVPYVLAGAGGTRLSFPGLSDTSIAWQAAAGSRFFFGDTHRAAFRIEIGWIFDQAFDQSNRDESYAVGFTWRLGEP